MASITIIKPAVNLSMRLSQLFKEKGASKHVVEIVFDKNGNTLLVVNHSGQVEEIGRIGDTLTLAET